MILRRWKGLIRSAEREAYREYIVATGGTDYTSTPGNLGFQMLFRDLGDGTCEVTTLSWWRSLADITGFAGDDITIARYYPEDDRFLLDRPKHVEHHDVAESSLSL
jgi:heme-degrading monooxygenase HmoA